MGISNKFVVFEDNIVFLLKETQKYEDTFEFMKDKYNFWCKLLMVVNTVTLGVIGSYLQIG
jgi:hypothetical protein